MPLLGEMKQAFIHHLGPRAKPFDLFCINPCMALIGAHEEKT